MTPASIAHPPSLITSLIPSFHLITTYRFLDNHTTTTHHNFQRNHYNSPPPPPRPQRHHLELDLARSHFALSHQQRKEDTAARVTASRWVH
jgi:hypothetical protein